MRILAGRLLAPWDSLVQGKHLMNVTTGASGEILALSVDPNWTSPDYALPPYTVSIHSLQPDSMDILTIPSLMYRVSNVQRLGTGDFLLMARAVSNDTEPNAFVVTRNATTRTMLALARGIQDVQVDRKQRIWICLSDQAAFSRRDIAGESLVCFDPDFQPIFRFNTRASATSQPRMFDCDALNVASSGDAYVHYDSIDPSRGHWIARVDIDDDAISDVWRLDVRRFPEIRGAVEFAINGTQLLLAGSYEERSRLSLYDLSNQSVEKAIAVAPDGHVIEIVDHPGGRMASRSTWGRGDQLYLLDRRGVWQVTVPPN